MPTRSIQELVPTPRTRANVAVLLLATTLSLAAGCLGGYVYDETGTALTNQTVTIYDCLDSGCLFRNFLTDSTGLYVHDPYDSSGNLVDDYFFSDETVRYGVIVKKWPKHTAVYDDGRWQCNVEEEVVKVHRPQYGLHSSGEYYDQIPDIYVGTFRYDGSCSNAPNYAPDYDNDGISDLTEANYGTDWNDADTDDDGILDGVEVFGVDFYYSGNERVFVARNDLLWHEGASPRHKDVFLTIDYQRARNDIGATYSLQPPGPFRDAARTYFQDTNGITNPDGVNGFRFHIDVGNEIGEQSGQPRMLDEYPLGNSDPSNPGNRVDERQRQTHLYTPFVFRAWNGDGGGSGPSDPSDFNTYGFDCYKPGFGVYLGLASFGKPRFHTCSPYMPPPSNQWLGSGSVHVNWVTIMHEWGHAVSLRHGGNEDRNRKPNYPSVMNYRYADTFGQTMNSTLVRFSQGTWSDLNESSLSELQSLGNDFDWDGDDRTILHRFGGVASGPPPLDGYRFGVIEGDTYGCNSLDYCIDWDNDDGTDISTVQRVLRVGGDDWQTTNYQGPYSDFDDAAWINSHIGDPVWGNASHSPVIPYVSAYRPELNLDEVEEGPLDSDTRKALAAITGREGATLDRFLERAGFDLERDRLMLAKFGRAVRTDLQHRPIGRIARRLFPDGVPAWISNAELERAVSEFVVARIEARIGYKPEIVIESCAAPAATLAKFRGLAEALVENRNATAGDTPRAARGLEDVIPSIPEEGIIAICR